MGQKCNPTGLRIGVIKNWDSKWCTPGTAVKKYSQSAYITEVKRKLRKSSIPKIYERKIGDVLPIAFCSSVYKAPI